jgi:hypothetical protein
MQKLQPSSRFGHVVYDGESPGKMSGNGCCVTLTGQTVTARYEVTFTPSAEGKVSC